MDFNKFSNFLKENNLDLDSISKTSKPFSITANGTYAKGSELYIDNCSLIFSSTNEKNSLTITKKKREIESFEKEFPLMDYYCSFLQFSTDSFFFSSNSTVLAQISLIMSVLNSKNNVNIKTITDKEIFISFIQKENSKQFFPVFSRAEKKIDFNFLSPRKELGKIYSGKISNFTVFSAVFPFIGLEINPKLPPPPYAYKSSLPEDVFMPQENDALIQGIISLSKKIEEEEKELQKTTDSPLEVTRLEMESDNNAIRQQIKIEKETLKRELTNPKSIGDLMSEFETSIAHKLNFGGSAVITGKEAAELLRKLK